MTSALNSVLLGLLGLFGYTWVGYYLILRWLAHRHSRKFPATDAPVAEDSPTHPSVAIIIAAYNEADVIISRLKNIQELNYPAEKIAVYLGCDGCSDDTVARAKTVSETDQRIQVIAFQENRGKVAVLKDLVKRARSNPAHEFLVFSDANTMFASGALGKLLRHFGDSAVGGVCGRLAFVRGNATENPAEEGAYWRMETRLKQWESKLDSCLGANGAIYAIRPELFPEQIPDNTIVEDFVIGMKVREQGYRMIYDYKALVTEDLPEIGDEWNRRTRIGAGDYQAMVLCRRCLAPRFTAFAWIFWSHKILRWFTPHILLGILILSWGLCISHAIAENPATYWYVADILVATGSIGFVITGILGYFLRHKKQTTLFGKIFAVSAHFITMHAALFIGFIRFCSGNLSGNWKRTPRATD